MRRLGLSVYPVSIGALVLVGEEAAEVDSGNSIQVLHS